MVNIDIMELYKMYAANPDTFQLVFKNLVFHELLVIKEGITRTTTEISDLSNSDLIIYSKTGQIALKLAKLPDLFEPAISAAEYFRCVPISGQYTGEDVRIRLGIAQEKVRKIEADFSNNLSKYAHVEDSEAYEKEFASSMEHMLESLNDTVDSLVKIEGFYARATDKKLA